MIYFEVQARDPDSKSRDFNPGQNSQIPGSGPGIPIPNLYYTKYLYVQAKALAFGSWLMLAQPTGISFFHLSWTSRFVIINIMSETIPKTKEKLRLELKREISTQIHADLKVVWSCGLLCILPNILKTLKTLTLCNYAMKIIRLQILCNMLKILQWVFSWGWESVGWAFSGHELPSRRFLLLSCCKDKRDHIINCDG